MDAANEETSQTIQNTESGLNTPLGNTLATKATRKEASTDRITSITSTILLSRYLEVKLDKCFSKLGLKTDYFSFCV